MKKPWLNNKWVVVSLHIAFWLLLFLLPYLSQPERQPRDERPSREAYELFNFIKSGYWVILFYVNAYVLIPKFIRSKKYVLYGLSLCAATIILSLLEISYFHLMGYDRPFSLGNFVFFNFFPFLFIITASSAYRLFTDRAAEEKLRGQKEAENLKSELSFLRSQISPHFMFNVLNNIVALARKKSDQVEPSLIKLSAIMRYFLYENAQDTIPLEKEIEYLKNYIQLQEQRFGSTTVVQFDIKGPDAPYEIEPMLLIPFVENAFKHGIIQNGSIIVKLEAVNNLLRFFVQNRYAAFENHTKDKTSGIGLANVRRRLNLLYSNRYTLSIDNSNEMYTVSLEIKLH